MDTFNIDDIKSLLPQELSEQKKGRLITALKQFHSKDIAQKNYTDFYSTSSFSYFLQGDLVKDLRFPSWDDESGTFEKVYHNVVLISNTCDMDENNPRDIPKQVMIAKLIELDKFENALHELEVTNSDVIINNVKSQHYSNIIYLPFTKDAEYIAYLDEISWISLEELKALKKDIDMNRISILDHFGFYLFVFKLSYHLHRLPEATDR